MAALMRLRVEPFEGDAYEVNIGPKVIVEIERQFKSPMTDLFGEGARFEALYWAAWKGSQIAGRPTKPFDEWLSEIEAIDPVEEQRLPLENP